ncbi:rhamnulokinase [Pseudonocardia xinjiangensis]|uniref:Rhamnulokinase n=1 Tax=Pseudonocardia xinjiangensis TaxID=75289 RepID=A0ABX1RL44_9PSEU|nr:rhamnulokinase family protein [Pseudonocardia xinjiangensis]NMH80354.1 rhamnulokinase [Pseudonocardia xinjiangensis]
MAAEVGPDRLELTEAARFPNGPVRLGDTLHWDVLALYRGILDGLRAAGAQAPLDAVGIDSWAIDYGLLDATGSLLGNPVHYRDARTDGVAGRVHATVPTAELYATNGVQELPFTTIYQLVAATGSPQLAAARDLLLMPDLLGYWLTGVRRAELTNASTTGLLDVKARTWSTGLMARTGIDAGLFAPLVEPGERVGELAPHVLAETGLAGPVPLIAVGSHDTASAVVGVPATGERFAYVSCGTWSLVGVELDAPVLSEAGRAANFSNELGVDGSVRYLRNVMGLWLLQECLRAWPGADLAALLAEAAQVPAFAALVDADHPAFLPPGDMPARIAEACERRGETPPQGRAATVRCILDSLALAHRRAVRDAQELSGRAVDVVHVVGGGARNALLCRLTADACGLPVVAGPVEATALGNVLVQARALGAVEGGLAQLRALLVRTQELVTYEPRADEAAWASAERRVHP